MARLDPDRLFTYLRLATRPEWPTPGGFLLQTRLRHGGLGLYYYGARYYDAELGRFLAVDPARGRYPGWSPYIYCANNPLKYVDPDGREYYRKAAVYEYDASVYPVGPMTPEMKAQYDVLYGTHGPNYRVSLNSGVRVGFDTPEHAVNKALPLLNIVANVEEGNTAGVVTSIISTAVAGVSLGGSEAVAILSGCLTAVAGGGFMIDLTELDDPAVITRFNETLGKGKVFETTVDAAAAYQSVVNEVNKEQEDNPESE